MSDKSTATPRNFYGIMVSSTFNDLESHRHALIDAINSQNFHQIAMEDDHAKPIDVIDSSLQMVKDCFAYVGIISHRYGQTPICPYRNPNKLSITELEFNEAQRLERPIIIFIMGNSHLIKKSDVEFDPENELKLDHLKKKVKLIHPTSLVHRVYSEFNSLEEFTKMAIKSIAGLRQHTDLLYNKSNDQSDIFKSFNNLEANYIPKPPIFYARPPYIGSHTFVGRNSQLETLSDWANPADSHPILLFEAIGGTGKSMLTWEWTIKHSTKVRSDWQGRFWYSFYERGATMLDFCRRAISYMSEQPISNFKEKSTAELITPIIQYLQSNPWLIILDGLERVLVSYHRFDAAQIQDESAGTADKIARRDPCSAINPEDDELLHLLAGASPSKLLLTSRLIPRVLINNSNQTIPGVLREHLSGLRPADAEVLINACGVKGNSLKIQNYLKSHCDCHPLIIGVLAGMITHYLPDRGNFDAWSSDPNGGGKLNLAELPLVQKRNHILNAALSELSQETKKLLSTLALLSESVNYSTLSAINPNLISKPNEISEPLDPRLETYWSRKSVNQQNFQINKYEENLIEYNQYLEKFELYNITRMKADENLTSMVTELETRGLLQYDQSQKRYDLHPVVRGVSAGGLKMEEKNLYGQRVVDHFSQQYINPYYQADNLEDFDNARHIVRVLFQMENKEKAYQFMKENQILTILNQKFEAHNNILEMIQPLFPMGWSELPEKFGNYFISNAIVSLRRINAFEDSFELGLKSLLFSVNKNENIIRILPKIRALSNSAGDLNYLALENRLLKILKHISFNYGSENDIDYYRLAQFRHLSKIGNWEEADKIWKTIQYEELDYLGKGIASHHYALQLYFRDRLDNETLLWAENANKPKLSALGHRNLCTLRGYWRISKNEFKLAIPSLNKAIAFAHKVGKTDKRSEIWLAIAKFKLNKIKNPTQIVEQLSYSVQDECHYPLAYLLHLMGDIELAIKHAHAACTWAISDGKPFVRIHELNRSLELISKLGDNHPSIPNYNYTKDKRFEWEIKLHKYIQTLPLSK